MKQELNHIVAMELISVENLLKALEKQHSCLIKSNPIELENCVAEIENCNRAIANWEVKRREVTQGRPMSEIIDEIKDNELEQNYRKIKRMLEETIIQKDTNDLLIKQGLGFTNRILNILNPTRTPKTYNSYGKIHR